MNDIQLPKEHLFLQRLLKTKLATGSVVLMEHLEAIDARILSDFHFIKDVRGRMEEIQLTLAIENARAEETRRDLEARLLATDMAGQRVAELADQEVAELKGHLAESVEIIKECAVTLKTCVGLEDEVERKESVIQRLLEQKEEHVNFLEDKEEYIFALEDRIADFEESEEDYERSLECMSEEIDSLNDDNRHLQEYCQTLEEDLDVQEDAVESLSVKLDEERICNISNALQISSLEAEVTELQTALIVVTRKIDEDTKVTPLKKIALKGPKPVKVKKAKVAAKPVKVKKVKKVKFADKPFKKLDKNATK